jgi:ribosomal protein L34
MRAPRRYVSAPPAWPGHPPMKLRVRRSSLKRKKKVGYRTRSKTTGGRKVIKRKLKRAGKFRVG